MLFNSYIFVLVFLPLVTVGYFGLNRRNRAFEGKVFLCFMSLWFYGWFNLSYLFLIILSIIINYSLSALMHKTENVRHRKAVAAAGCVLNLGVLFYYKYFDFFIENINTVFSADFLMQNLLLPLGISFFTFQQVSFLIDTYKREAPAYHFVDYALFVSFFPQLIAGPIVLHGEIVPQFADVTKKRFNPENFARGLFAFSLGLAKKVLLADIFGKAVAFGYAALPWLSRADACIVILAYTFQIYFDFSGYCDMAYGLGFMLNIDIPQNFNSPYKARSITEFWKRWHMTLTRFFTRYLYIPLGGSRHGMVRTYINVFLVFLISGLWHGANWTFVLWGAMHGAFSCFTRAIQSKWDKLPGIIGWAVTFVFVNITWVFFRAPSIGAAVELLTRLISPTLSGVSNSILSGFMLNEFESVIKLFAPSLQLPAIFTALYLAFGVYISMLTPNVRQLTERFSPRLSSGAATAVLFTWSVLSFAGVSTFLYFNF